MSKVNVIDHPLVQHKLSLMRKTDTPTGRFRQLLREISVLLCYEVTRDLPIEKRTIETPLRVTDAPFISGNESTSGLIVSSTIWRLSGFAQPGNGHELRLRARRTRLVMTMSPCGPRPVIQSAGLRINVVNFIIAPSW